MSSISGKLSLVRLSLRMSGTVFGQAYSVCLTPEKRKFFPLLSKTVISVKQLKARTSTVFLNAPLSVACWSKFVKIWILYLRINWPLNIFSTFWEYNQPH